MKAARMLRALPLLFLLLPLPVRAQTGMETSVASPAEAARTEVVPHVRPGGEDGHRLHVRLDSSFLFAIGGQSALGTALHALGEIPVWITRVGTGTIDVGLLLGYTNEPVALAPWLTGMDVSGSVNRVQALLSVGHTAFVGKERRSSIGVHLVGGLNYWNSTYSLRYPSEGLSGKATIDRSSFLVGGQLCYAYRFSRYVGFHLLAGGPFPVLQSSYVQTMFWVGAGLSFYLR